MLAFYEREDTWGARHLRVCNGDRPVTGNEALGVRRLGGSLYEVDFGCTRLRRVDLDSGDNSVHLVLVQSTQQVVNVAVV